MLFKNAGSNNKFINLGRSKDEPMSLLAKYAYYLAK